jgi:alkaline phosphatase
LSWRTNPGLAVALVFAAALALACVWATRAQAQEEEGHPEGGGTGSVVFIHPDGTGPNHWQAMRSYWYGPDEVANWDSLPEEAVYRGHMADQLAGTSNGGATTHAFGFKVEGQGSFGQDGDRIIDSLSGFEGSIMRQAQYEGYPVGVVNDGTVTEPGTGAFLAEVDDRDDHEGIALEMLNGRTGNGEGEESPDPDPQVMLGGGERWFLPEGEVGYHGPGSRTDGRNLIEEAEAKGYEVVRTRGEFEELMAGLTSAECEAAPTAQGCAPKVLGLFARNDTFNDAPEEALIDAGLRVPGVEEDDKRSNLLLYGTHEGVPNPNNTTEDPGDPEGETDAGDLPEDLEASNGELVTANGQDPPTVGEMTEMALLILSRAEAQTGLPFVLVAEPESPDNLGNNNNSVGVLNATYRSDLAIGEAIEYQQTVDPDTLVVTAADSDAGGMQLYAVTPDEETGELPETVGTEDYNPTGNEDDAVEVPLDGLYGRDTQPFVAEEDQFGEELSFAMSMVNTADVQGGIVSRAVGGNAERLASEELSARFDNVDIYRTMHENLFGVFPEYPEGERAPTREAEASVTMPETGGVALVGHGATPSAPLLAGLGLLAGAVLLLGGFLVLRTRE